MNNRLFIAITFVTFSFSAVQLATYSHPSSAKSSLLRQGYGGQAGGRSKTTKGKQKTKKPEYYRPGHSDGLQNWPGKTIDAGANTGMLSTNSSSPLMGNDITY